MAGGGVGGRVPRSSADQVTAIGHIDGRRRVNRQRIGDQQLQGVGRVGGRVPVREDAALDQVDVAGFDVHLLRGSGHHAGPGDDQTIDDERRFACLAQRCPHAGSGVVAIDTEHALAAVVLEVDRPHRRRAAAAVAGVCSDVLLQFEVIVRVVVDGDPAAATRATRAIAIAAVGGDEAFAGQLADVQSNAATRAGGVAVGVAIASTGQDGAVDLSGVRTEAHQSPAASALVPGLTAAGSQFVGIQVVAVGPVGRAVGVIEAEAPVAAAAVQRRRAHGGVAHRMAGEVATVGDVDGGVCVDKERLCDGQTQGEFLSRRGVLMRQHPLLKDVNILGFDGYVRERRCDDVVPGDHQTIDIKDRVTGHAEWRPHTGSGIVAVEAQDSFSARVFQEDRPDCRGAAAAVATVGSDLLFDVEAVERVVVDGNAAAAARAAGAVAVATVGRDESAARQLADVQSNTTARAGGVAIGVAVATVCQDGAVDPGVTGGEAHQSPAAAALIPGITTAGTELVGISVVPIGPVWRAIGIVKAQPSVAAATVQCRRPGRCIPDGTAGQVAAIGDIDRRGRIDGQAAADRDVKAEVLGCREVPVRQDAMLEHIDVLRRHWDVIDRCRHHAGADDDEALDVEGTVAEVAEWRPHARGLTVAVEA